jgi:hypothetical protein
VGSIWQTTSVVDPTNPKDESLQSVRSIVMTYVAETWTWARLVHKFKVPPSMTFIFVWVIVLRKLHFHIYYLFVGFFVFLFSYLFWGLLSI